MQRLINTLIAGALMFILIFVIIPVVLVSAASFVTWSFEPFKWAWEQQSLSGFRFSVILCLFLGFLFSTLIED